MRKRLLCCLLVFCLLANLLVGFTALAADTVSTGTVKADKLYVRSGPGTSHPAVGDLANGDVVTIHETVTNDSGERWYRISKDSLNGYVHSGYIIVNATYETDEQFEAYLTAQGFPEDYKVALRQVHAQYPNWIFRAQHLSMTWAEALAAETKVGLNTIQSPDAWKSMEYSAYNWNTNSYVVFDSGGWVTAAPSVVAYHMDPRNWLDATRIFQFEDLSYSDDQTSDGIKAILPDALDKHAEDVLKASKETKVSAYFLATRMTQEGSHLNGLGTGEHGYYNFFNYGAYAVYENGVEVLSAVQNGALYAKNQGWDTPYKCLVASAERIGKGYINLGQNTLYYQKFNFTNTTSGLYGHQYMSNVAAPSSEGRIRRNAASEAELNNNITFNIPVFKSMPTSAAPMPSKTGNNNNFLDNITVEGYSLTPTFNRYTMTYSLHVGEATSVKIAAALNNPAAKLEGVGTIQLYKGDNEIPLTVTATSGEKRVYRVIVTTTGGVERPNAPVITGSVYAVNGTVTKVEPETSVTDFINRLAVSNGRAIVTNAAGELKNGIVATGDIVRLYSGNILCASYPIVIYGDVNGDGKISSVDILRMQKHIVGIITLSGYQLQAADVDKNTSIQPKDVLRGQKYIVDLIKTIQ